MKKVDTGVEAGSSDEDRTCSGQHEKERDIRPRLTKLGLHASTALPAINLG